MKTRFDFHRFYRGLNHKERERFAKKVGLNAHYIYQFYSDVNGPIRYPRPDSFSALCKEIERRNLANRQEIKAWFDQLYE